MKKTGTVYKGKATPKADVTIILSDDTLVDLASGKVRSLLPCRSGGTLTFDLWYCCRRTDRRRS